MSKIHQLSELDILVMCPHCLDSILIEQLNCCIFRHGTLKSNGQQINPHASKELCDYYIENSLIFGCGKPFQVIKNNEGKFMTIICDYNL
jgi:hypothetical protein